MPYSRDYRGEYPDNWDEIADRTKAEADHKCVRCGHPHDVEAGYMLTVHHLDKDKSNCAWWNLIATCQRCHLILEGKVDMKQGWMFDHSSWFMPYVAGYYAHQNGLQEDREYVEAHLEELLAIGKPNGLRPLLAG